MLCWLLPLKTRDKVPFEQLIGTKETLFRMAAVVAGLIVAAGSLGYLYLTITTASRTWLHGRVFWRSSTQSWAC